MPSSSIRAALSGHLDELRRPAARERAGRHHHVPHPKPDNPSPLPKAAEAPSSGPKVQ